MGLRRLFSKLAKDTSFSSHPETFFQIGSDQELLSSPQSIETVILGPGERIDLVIDFAPHAREQLYLRTRYAHVMQFRVARDKVQDSSRLPASLTNSRESSCFARAN